MYGAATRVLQVGLFPIQVATRITYPKFFEARHGGLTGLRAYAMRISIPLLAVGIASAVCVMIASSVLPLVLGRGFAQSVNIAMLLSLGLPFVALQSPPGDVLVAAHQHTLRAAIYWGSAVIFAIVLLVGVLLGGTTGLALGYVGGQATLAVALWVAVFRCKPVAPKPSLPGLDGPMIDETAAI
jgi:O-antigen/teichoic acid export membrane protein